MKTIITIIFGILLLSCVSAIDITAGETYSFVLNEQYAYYEVTGNQTEIDLNINQNGTEVTIIFGKYIKSDTFLITFYNWKEEVIEQRQGGGSSYSKKKVIEDNEIIEEENETIEEDFIDEPEEIIEEEKNVLKIILWILIVIVLIFLIWRGFR